MMWWESSKRLVTAVLLLCSGPLALGSVVRWTEGQAITLTCSYRVTTKSDITTMCWGRGSCPNSKCSQVIINTDGYKVTYRSEDRYVLNGDISKGQVSLTIGQARLEDEGTYCCRVEHHGWFNDMKLNIQLKVDKAPATSPPTTSPKPAPTKKKAPPTTTTALIATTHGAITELKQDDLTTDFTTIMPDDTSRLATNIYSLETTAVPISPEIANPTTHHDEFIKTMFAVTSRSHPTTQHKHTSVMTKPQTTTFLQHVATYEITTEPELHDPISDDTTLEMVDVSTLFGSSVTPITVSDGTEIKESNESILDRLSENMTDQEKVKSRNSLHIVLIVIGLSVIILTAGALLVIKLRGKDKYLFHTDPSLELVAHEEDHINEKSFNESGANNIDKGQMMTEDEMDRLSSEAETLPCKEPETDKLSSTEIETESKRAGWTNT